MAFLLLCSAPTFKAFLLLLLLLSFHFFSAVSTEFLVGDDDGWEVPDPKETGKYNKWASRNRFSVHDTVNFRYKKDSVMVVTEEEYKECLSSKPLFYDNSGNSVVKLDRPGLFYFISGVTGHCQKGQRMIIKVLEPVSPPHPPTPPPHDTKKAAAANLLSVSSPILGMFFLFVASFLFI